MKINNYGAICSFFSQFGITPPFKKNELIVKGKRVFLSAEIFSNTLYTGEFLGEFRRGSFIPSMHLIRTHLADAKNQLVLGKKAAWLFMCGRDVFAQSLKQTFEPGRFILIKDEDDVIGYGVTKSGKIAIENKRDIGEFLRRELTN